MGSKSKKEMKLRELKRLRRERRFQHRLFGKPAAEESKPEKDLKTEPAHATKSKVPRWYAVHYKPLLIVPMAILVIAIVLIAVKVATTGDFVNKGISLSGGLSVTILTDQDIDVTALQNQLETKYPNYEPSVRSLAETGTQIGITIEAAVDANDKDGIDAFLNSIQEYTGINKSEFSIEAIGSALGSSFFQQTFRAIILAFIFMSIVVFIYFRSFIPSAAIVLCAFSDIITTLAVFNLTGIKLSTAGVAAFLMLVGYSVDTDIVLTTKVLRGKQGTVLDRVITAFKTGMMMTLTTLAAAVVAFFFSPSEVIKQIMLILIIGLFADMLYTWIQNACIIRWYMDRKELKEKNA
jgi:preprotein translocase subunit SecF